MDSAVSEFDGTVIIPDTHDCIYTRCFCEENVWQLCKKISQTKPTELETCFVVFISNKNKTVPVWHQKACTSEDRPVIWDYHVIFVHRPTQEESLVYDLDTRLPFPCVFNQYAGLAIQPDDILRQEFHRSFRVVNAITYIEKFASDRSHMLKDDKTWMAPPPQYPCIQTNDSENNLQHFISMDPSVGYGDVMDTPTFIGTFGQYEKTLEIFFKQKQS